MDRTTQYGTVVLLGGCLLAGTFAAGPLLRQAQFRASTPPQSEPGCSAIHGMALVGTGRCLTFSGGGLEIVVHQLDGPPAPVGRLAIDQVSAVAGMEGDETIVIGNHVGDVRLHRRGYPGGERSFPGVHNWSVVAAALSSDGCMAATATSRGQIHLWDIPAGRRVLTIDERQGMVQDLSFTSDRRHLVVCIGCRASLRNTATGELVQVFEGHAGLVMDAELLDDEQTLITASIDRTLRLWNVEFGEELWASEPDVNAYMNIAADPSCRVVACGNLDGQLSMLDLSLREIVGIFSAHASGVRRVEYTRTGDRLISAGYDGTIGVWDPKTMILMNRIH